MNLDLVVLGNLIVDDIVYDNGETRMAQPGGAVLYMGLTASLWEIRIGLVSVAGSDFPDPVLRALEQRRISLEGVRRSAEPGLRTWLLYEGDIRRVVHRLDGPTHRDSSPTAEDLPARWHPRALHLAPMPFDLQDDLATRLRIRCGEKALLSLDPFELLTGEGVEAWQRLLARVQLFFISEDELVCHRSGLDPERFLRTLVTGRLDTIFYKQGGRGGQVLGRTGFSQSRWPARAASVIDTTGAGDAFACGVLAGLLKNRPLERALQWGIVSASFAIQGQGIDGLLGANPALAQERLLDWFGPETTLRGGALGDPGS